MNTKENTEKINKTTQENDNHNDNNQKNDNHDDNKINNNEILLLKNQIVELQKTNDNLKELKTVNNLLNERIYGFVENISNKYKVNNFDFQKYDSELNWKSLENLEKSILNIFEKNHIKYEKPQNKKIEKSNTKIYI